MKYFEVEKEIMITCPKRYLVNADGSEASDEYDIDDIFEVCTGFNVREIDEEGNTLALEFYPVMTRTDIFEDNSLEVLEQIKHDYSVAKGWQNNNW